MEQESSNEITVDVSVIIVNYHTSRLINDCISSIKKYTNGVSYEIIIVDNASEDLSNVILADGQSIRFVQLNENKGFGAANNEAFKIAKGRNLFCLNPDTILLNNAIKILSECLDSHPTCGACGGNLFNKELGPNLSYKRLFPGYIEETDQFFKRKLTSLLYGRNYMFNNSKKIKKVAYINGADLMLRNDLIHKIGGFDKDFFLYYEETELQYRIYKSGYEILSVPQAKIIHLEGQSFEISYQRERNALISRKLFYEKTKGLYNRRIINIYYTLLNQIGFFIAKLFKLKTEQRKLRNRLDILNEIN